MELFEEYGGRLAIVLVVVLAVIAGLFSGVINSKSTVSAYQNVVGGINHAVKYAVTEDASETVNYYCGDYEYTKTLTVKVDGGDQFGFQNAETRLAKRMTAEIAKLKKQGCDTFVIIK